MISVGKREYKKLSDEIQDKIVFLASAIKNNKVLDQQATARQKQRLTQVIDDMVNVFKNGGDGMSEFMDIIDMFTEANQIAKAVDPRCSTWLEPDLYLLLYYMLTKFYISEKE